ncbi:hypothetical protein CR513_01831, partial [Mucuna pruriens]
MVQKGNTLVTTFLGVVPISVHSWIIDSGETNHMIGCSKMFSSYNPCASNKKVKIADGSLSTIARIEIIKLTSLITLHNVLHELTIKRMIVSAKERDRLYYFDDGPDLSKQCPNIFLNSTFVSQDNDIMLGHPSFQYLKYLFPNLFINKSPFSLQCEICQFANHHTPFPSHPYKSTVPYKTSNIFGKKWFVTFINDHTRLSWVNERKI